jgi:hypothetical protein
VGGFATSFFRANPGEFLGDLGLRLTTSDYKHILFSGKASLSQNLVFFFSIFLSFFISVSAFATTQSGITYQGRILDPAGAPVTDSAVQFKLQIRTPDASNCLMYEEVQTIDMSANDGAFAITINDGSGIRTDSSGYTIDNIFANRSSYTFAAAVCTGSTTFIPNTGDGRRLQVYFKSTTMTVWEPIPAQNLNFIPQAIEAKQVGGYQPGDLLRVDKTPAQTVAAFTYSDYTNLVALLAGTSTQYLSTSTTQGAALPAYASNPAAPTSGSLWYDSTLKQVKYFDGTGIQTFGVGGGSVSAIFTGAGLTGGPITASGTISIANAGVNTPQIASSAITDPKIASGTITGDKFDPALTVSTTGNITAAQVSTTTTSARSLLLYDPDAPGINKITFSAPTSLASDWSLALPASAPTNGQSLVSDAAGNLSWTTAGAGTFAFGSVAAPGIAFTSEPATGLYRPASGTLSATSGGVESLRMISSAGGVNYLTITPSATSQAVQLGAGGSDTNIDIKIAPKGNGNTLVTGNVGIGTTAPSARLHLGPGIATASGAPLKFTSGPTLITPEAGAVEYDGNFLYITNASGTRNPLITGATITTSFSAGSAAGPGWAVTGNSNTGLFSPAANTLSISAGGTEGLRINPASGALDYVAITPGGVSTTGVSVAGSDTNIDLALSPKGSGAVTTIAPVVVSNPTVSTSPTTGALTVVGGAGIGGKLFVANSINANAGGFFLGGVNTIYTASSAAATWPYVAANTGTTVGIANGSNTDSSGSFYQMSVRNTLNLLQNAYIGTISTTGAGVYSPSMVFGTQSGSSSYQERMRIDSAGNVGIGTSSPTSSLEVGSGNLAVDNGYANITSTSAGIVGGLTLGNNHPNPAADRGAGIKFAGQNSLVSIGAINSAYTDASGNLSYMSFSTRTGGLTEHMRLDAIGNVGIGTTSPSARLDVNGKFILEASNPGTGYAGFAAPASMTSSTIWTLPPADGASGTVLTTNGAGSLLWTTPGGTQTSFLSGSAAAPGWSVTGNTNTGLFSPSTNILSIATGGAEGLRINSASSATDYIAISPGGASSTQISTAGTDANIDLSFAPKGSGNTVFANGNVGIGTTAPSFSLHVLNNSANIAMLEMQNVAANTGPAFIGRRAHDASGAISATQSGDFIATFGARGYGATGWAPFSTAAIIAIAEENFSDTVRGTGLNFKTTPNGSGSSQLRMVINNAGYVGIGQGTPTARLHLAAGIAAASGAPFKLAAGVNLTTPEPGAVEYDGNYLYITNASGTRQALATSGGAGTFNAGSAAAPGWSVTGNTNTGLFSPASNTLSLSAGGIEGLRVNTASGAADYIAITPGGVSSTQISTAGTDANIDLSFAPKGIGNTVFANGNVGIGTTMPSSPLHVVGLGAARFESNSGGINTPLTLRNTNGAFSGIATSISMESGSLVTQAKIIAGPDGNSSRGYLSLSTRQSNTTLETMRLDGSGNVGIGTTTPLARLQLPAGGPSASSAPLMFTTGTLLVTPASGAVEYDGSFLYLTDSTNTRRTIATSGGAGTFNAGSAAAPGWSVTGNTNTGLFSAASNTISLSAGGVEGLRVNTASGAADYIALTPGGVSTTSIGVAGTDANIDLNLSPKGAGSTIIASGKVGIGTTTANDSLVVVGSANGSGSGHIIVQNTSGGGNAAANFQATGDNNSFTLFGQSSSGFSLYPVIPNGSGFIYNNLANGLTFDAAGTTTATAIRFATGGSAVTNERMRIDVNGNVGIGTTAPLARLHLPAGGPSASSAPLMFTTGTLLATPASGAVEYDGNYLYLTNSAGTRTQLATGAAGTFIGNAGTASAPSHSFTADTMTGMYDSSIGTLGFAASGVVAITAASNVVNIPLTTAANSTTTGALTVAGGLGVAGKIFSGGIMSSAGGLTTAANVNNIYAASSATLYWPYQGANSGSTLSAGNFQPSDGMGSFVELSAKNLSGNLQFGYLGVISNTGATNYSPNIVIGQQTGAAAYNERMRIDQNGNVGIGTTAPLARLHLPAGGPSASSAPLMFTTGTLLATPASGAVEYDGNYLYLTDSTNIRRTIATAGGAGSFNAGSAAAPGWSVTGNTNTGLFSAASNAISLAAGGVEALRASFISGAVNFASIAPSSTGNAVIYSVGGTDANINLELLAKGTGSIIMPAPASVGIGNSAPATALDVTGSIRSSGVGGASTANAAASADWSKGNNQSMSVACTATTFTNMLDGATYNLLVTDTSATQCVFTQAGLTFLFAPANGSRVAGKNTLYSFTRIGANVVVAWAVLN